MLWLFLSCLKNPQQGKKLRFRLGFYYLKIEDDEALMLSATDLVKTWVRTRVVTYIYEPDYNCYVKFIYRSFAKFTEEIKQKKLWGFNFILFAKISW